MQNTLTTILETTTQKLIYIVPNLVLAVIVLVVGFKLRKKFEQALLKQYQRQNIDSTVINFTHSLVSTIYKAAVILFAISIAGVQTTSIVAILGAFSFAIALALKSSMSDFASGLLILTNKTIKIGERIELKSHQGTVINIEVFHTTLLTDDKKTVTIPNSHITTNIIINHSRTGSKNIKKNEEKN